MTSQPISKTLAQLVTLRCLDLDAGLMEIEARFEYDARDPFAVWITFEDGRNCIRWAVCRSLLSLGLTDPAGEGDLQLWPSVDEDGRGVVVLEFCSPDGHLAVQASTRELYRFLTRTLAVVPFGTESQVLDLDSVIEDLLRFSESE